MGQDDCLRCVDDIVHAVEDCNVSIKLYVPNSKALKATLICTNIFSSTRETIS